MKYKIMTTGYTGKNIADLLPLLDWHDAVLFDIRFSPYSRHWQWKQDYLRELLGSRYCHLQNLGNRAYQEGRIEIVDLEAGIQTVLSAKTNAILMCGCAELQSCHRFVVMNELRRQQIEVVEIEDWKRSEPTLF